MAFLEFDTSTEQTFAVDQARRIIRGLLVPWAGIGRHSNGRKWRFARGSLRWVHPKYLRFNDEHNEGQRLGRGIEATDTDEGLMVAFRVDAGPAGDRALADAASGRKTGLSMEVDIDTMDTSADPENEGVLLVSMANLTGAGHVERPAFNESRIISVAASQEGRTMDTCATCGVTLEEGVAHTCATPEAAPVMPEGAVTLTAEQFSALLNRPAAPAPEVRPTVNPTHPVPNAGPVQVEEALPYRFSYDERNTKTVFHTGAEHDFSTDLISIVKLSQEHRDYAAPLARVNDLIKAAFADVESADVTAINPNRHRPDMWVRQRDYRTVLWDMIAAGTTDGTKFDVPKFTSSSGLVVPATEKVEPAGGSFVAELQTITPTQVWGKVEITRQAWRQGGSPQLSGILWDQMLREYYEDREAAAATFLNTLTAAADIALTGTPASSPDNDDDQVTAGELEAAIAMLQFDRGGDQISKAVAHRDLFKLLARVTDDAGRKLYPILNPQNASGSAQPRYRSLNVAGVEVVGSYALGASGTVSTNSWLFDPATVFGWASAPERLFWDFGATVQTANIPQLSFVTLGIYGDIAFANTDITGVRQVTYDPSV